MVAVALLLLVDVSAAPPAGAAPPGGRPAPGACDPTPFWECITTSAKVEYDLLARDGLKPTSVATDGLSLFLMDTASNKMRQIRFTAGDGLADLIEQLPWPIADPVARPAQFGVLVLGPRAFYAIVTVPDAGRPETSVPLLYRADRVPTAIRGGWRFLRQTAGPADVGLSAAVVNSTVWMVRSCGVCQGLRGQGSAFSVDWQPLATENNEILRPPGPTIDLGTSVVPRPAAGVTATKDAIYVFGGRDTPRTATRIPLKSGSPQGPVKTCDPNLRVDPCQSDLKNDRGVDSTDPAVPNPSTALIHANTIYLVGGNQPGKPAIERGRIDRTGNVPTEAWEPVPDPYLPSGVKILTAVFARGKLWIFRDDGRIQAMKVTATVPGQSRIAWGTTTALIQRNKADGTPDAPIFLEPRPPQPIRVRHGDKIDLTFDWTYTGAQELSNVTVDVAGTIADTGVRRSPIILTNPAPTTLPMKLDDLLSPPETGGTQIALSVAIPTCLTRPGSRAVRPCAGNQIVDRRGEYNLSVTISAGGQKLGPIQRVRFVVERGK